MKTATITSVDPTEHLNTPLWCVYGSNAFPSIICCKILKDPKYGFIIWGYSVWKRQPGFRTLGTNIQAFCDPRENPKFFLDQEDALDYLRKMTTPKE